MAGKKKGYPKQDEKTKKWFYVIEAGKDAYGNRIRKKGTFNTRKEAQIAMAAAITEVKNGCLQEKISTITLGDYLNYWLDNYAKTNTKPKTFAEYEKIIKKHIQVSIGNIKLKDLKSTQLQAYYNEKLVGLSAQSVLHHNRILSKALNDAIDWEYITKNVAKGAKPSKPIKREMKTHSVEQLNLLLKTTKEKSPVYFPIIYAAAHTGLRKSELMGLPWQYVDLNAQKLYIFQTITEANGKYFFNTVPKGKKARGLKLTTELAKLLEEMKIEHESRKKILGETYNSHNLVFCNSRGNIMAPSEITRALK